MTLYKTLEREVTLTTNLHCWAFPLYVSFVIIEEPEIGDYGAWYGSEMYGCFTLRVLCFTIKALWDKPQANA